jgi:hypothetical protein
VTWSSRPEQTAALLAAYREAPKLADRAAIRSIGLNLFAPTPAAPRTSRGPAQGGHGIACMAVLVENAVVSCELGF